MSDFEDNIDQEVDDIIAQLKNQSGPVPSEPQYPVLNENDVDQFILDQTSKVIVDVGDAIKNLRGNLQTATEITAFAELVGSAAKILDVLQKKKIADNKNKTSKELLNTTIEAKREIEETSGNTTKGIEISREELLKILADKANQLPSPEVTVEAEIIDEDQTPS